MARDVRTYVTSFASEFSSSMIQLSSKNPQDRLTHISAGIIEDYSTSLPHILGLLGSRLSPFRLYVSLVNNPSLAPQPNEESYILLGACASGIVRGPLGRRISHLSLCLIAILTLS